MLHMYTVLMVCYKLRKMTQNTISLSETNISSNKFNKWKQGIAITYIMKHPPPHLPTSAPHKDIAVFAVIIISPHNEVVYNLQFNLSNAFLDLGPFFDKMSVF